MGLKIKICFLGVILTALNLILAMDTLAQNSAILKYSESNANNNGENSKQLLEVNPPFIPADDSHLAITGCRLIDGNGGPPIEDAVVIIKGNKIISSGSKKEIDIPADALVYEAEGKTLMPGLIDAHYHSLMDNTKLFNILKKGVTTIRDPGHPFRFYQSLHFAEKPLPRVYLTGAHLDGFPAVYKSQALIIKDEKHAEQTVRDHVENGGTGIKIYFKLPLEYYEPIIKTANQLGVPVVAHLELVDADDAIRAGINGIEHVSSFGTSIAAPKDAKMFKEAVSTNYGARRTERFKLWAKIDVQSKRVQDVIKLAIENDVVLSPTLGVFERHKGDEGVEDFHVQGYRNMIQFVQMAHNAGMKIVLGSHTNLKYAEPGMAYQHEMKLLAKAGLAPMRIITSSTLENARYFRSEERIGSIEPGKLADLILIDANPDEDIEMINNIDRVMLNGKWLD